MAPAETLSRVPGGPYTVFKSCPVNFARVPDWCCHVLATMAGLATSHCVDDVLAVDRKTAIFSGWLVWRVLAAFCGWVVLDSKSPLPSQVHRILGATSDLSLTRSGPPTLSISQDRVSQLTYASAFHAIALKLLMEKLCTKPVFGALVVDVVSPFCKPYHMTSASPCWFSSNIQIKTCIYVRVIICFRPVTPVKSQAFVYKKTFETGNGLLAAPRIFGGGPSGTSDLELPDNYWRMTSFPFRDLAQMFSLSVVSHDQLGNLDDVFRDVAAPPLVFEFIFKNQAPRLVASHGTRPKLATERLHSRVMN